MLGEMLREKNGWVYGVEASYTQYSDSGIVAISFGCDRSNLEKCKCGMWKVISGLQDKNLSESRLKAAKKQLIAQLAVSSDNGETQCLSMGKSLLAYGTIFTDGHNVKAIEAVSAAQLRDAASRIFNPDKISSLIFL